MSRDRPASNTDMIESDMIEGALHPRENAELIGQEKAEQDFLQSWNSGRLHHAWLIRGPYGVGKATLAYRIARFLRTGGSRSDLSLPKDAPAFRQIAARTDSSLFTVTRTADSKSGKISRTISVDNIRELKRSLTLSDTDGGWKIAIIDSADYLNINAANALLKTLEEPPPRTVFLLLSNMSATLPVTVRSRCRLLNCYPLGTAQLHRAMKVSGSSLDGQRIDLLAKLANGAPGGLWRLEQAGAMDILAKAGALVKAYENPDNSQLFELTEYLKTSTTDPDWSNRVMISVLSFLLEEQARRRLAAGNLSEAASWARASIKVPLRLREAHNANLDPVRSLAHSFHSLSNEIRSIEII